VTGLQTTSKENRMSKHLAIAGLGDEAVANLCQSRGCKAFVSVLACLALFLAAAEQARPDFLYWNEYQQGGAILGANLGGSGQQTLITGQNGPAAFDLDLAGGKVYWTDNLSGDIRRANLDGSGQPEVLVRGLTSPVSLVLDLTSGKRTAFVYNQDCDFQVYETVIAIDPAHVGVGITSIDFTGAPDAFFSNIFALSGR
jgi:hypothetical protein